MQPNLWISGQSLQGSQSHYLQEILQAPVLVKLLVLALGFNAVSDSVSKNRAELFQLSCPVLLLSIELKLAWVGSSFSGSMVNETEIFKPRSTAQPGFAKMFISSEKKISSSLLHLAL